MTAAAGCRVSSGVTCAMNQRLKEALHVCSSPCTSCSPPPAQYKAGRCQPAKLALLFPQSSAVRALSTPAEAV